MSPLQTICRQPRIYLVDHFAEPHELEFILSIVRDPTEIVRRGFASQHNKAGLSFEWKVQGEPLLEALTRRTYELLGFENELGLSLRFRNYQVAEYHPGHLDVYQVENLYLVATAILYLNDTAAGGETSFPRAQPAPVAIAPKAGRPAIWFNYTPTGEPDPDAFHEALAVVEGEKLTLTNFIYKPLDFSKRER